MNLSLFLRLGRVSNLPTVWSNVLAGALLSGAAFHVNQLLVLCAAFSAFYVGGMFLNDAFDAEYDAVSRPERPIPRGEIDRTTVYTMGGALLVLGIMLIGMHSILFENQLRMEPLLYSISLSVCIIWYNADHQKTLIGPVLMGLNRVYVYATTAFALTTEPDVLVWYGCGGMLSYLIGLTFLSQQEDLRRASSLWPVAFLILALAYPVLSIFSGEAEWNGPLTLGVLLCLCVWVARSVSLLRPREGEPRTRQSIVSLIAGISLLDALAGGLRDHWLGVLVAFAAFALSLVGQKWVAGT
jgi:hypothetical protein